MQREIFQKVQNRPHVQFQRHVHLHHAREYSVLVGEGFNVSAVFGGDGCAGGGGTGLGGVVVGGEEEGEVAPGGVEGV